MSIKDQTARFVQSDLALYHPQKLFEATLTVNESIKFLPSDKILDRFKLKTKKKTDLKKNNFDLGSVEKIVGKGENADDQHFLLFPQCLPMVSFP